MPPYESEAIVLQSYPLGEADRLVSFLSRAMGCIRGVAAGARKTKSRFGSNLEPLSYIRIWFYERESRQLVRVNQCELIESFMDAFSDYESSVALSLFSEITEAVLPEHEASDANFRLLLLASQTVKRTKRTDIPLAYFTLWTVRLGGWLPSLENCGVCGRALDLTAPAYMRGGSSVVACEKCRTSGMRAVSRETINAARRMLTERLDRITGDSEKSIMSGGTREITKVMLDIIEGQIDRKLVSRRLLEPSA